MSDVTINFKDLGGSILKQMQNIQKQMTFAQMKALNEVAFKSRTNVISAYNSRFRSRNKTFPKTVRVDKATKEHLSATVSFPHDFFKLNDVGGEKRSGSGKSLAVPTSVGHGGNWESGQISTSRTPKGSVKKSMRPAELLRYHNTHPKKKKNNVANSHAFILDGKKGRFVARRKKENRKIMEFLYFLPKMGNVPARWDFEKIVEATSKRHLEKEFNRVLKWALEHPK